MSPGTYRAQTVLHPGQAVGRLLKLSDTLSFWGGFDPRDGRILDQSHPEAGQYIAGTILALPGSRGSAGTPAGVAEALRRKVGPVAILLPAPDVNIMIGAQVAAQLYGIGMPVLELSPRDYDGLINGARISVSGADVTVANMA